MFKKAFLFFAFIITIYNVFLVYCSPKWWKADQSTDQQNRIKAEAFLYDEKPTAKYIIVGSSLSNRIVDDSLKGVLKLSFGGQSIYEGLHLIVNKKNKPKAVLIEINKVFRSENTEFTSSLLSPLKFYPRKKILALREVNEPIPILGKMILQVIYHFKDWVLGKKAPVKLVKKDMPKNKSLDNLSSKMVKEAYDELLVIPNNVAKEHSFSVLKKYINQLESNGIKVMFFEMPIDNRLEQLPLPKNIRNEFLARFPVSKYCHIPLPKWEYCDTFDGQHLNDDDALRFTKYLNQQLAKE